MILNLVVTLFFIGTTAFFVLSEFALVRAQAAKLEVLVSQGRTRASLVLHMLKHLDTYLSAIQVGVTMSTLALGWVAEPFADKLVLSHLSLPSFLAPYSENISTAIAFGIIIYFQIVFAELVPRSIAIQRAEPIAIWMSVPLEIYYRVFRLPVVLMARSAIFVSRLLGYSTLSEHHDAFNEQEVRVLLGMSQEKGLLPLDRLLLMENLLDFSSLKVRDAMVGREKIVFLSTAKSWDENMEIIRSNHFSRLPVGDPDVDHITGFVHVKDFAFNGRGIPDLKDIARRIATVQDSTSLYPLLQMMTRQGKHMVLALKGEKVSGLITLEDVVEELIGEILDEFDAPHAWSFHNLIIPEAIDLELKGTTPEDAIHTLIERLKVSYPSLDAVSAERLVLDRERQLPTGIGKGVAVPHARIANLDRPVVAIGRSAKGIVFGGRDKSLVKLVFLILTPTSSPLDQLRILSRIGTLAGNETLKKQMLKTKAPSQFLEIIRTSESIVAG